MTLRLQIFLVVLAISAILLVSLDVLLPGRLQPYLIDRFATELKQEALLIRNTLETSVRSDQEMRQFANRIGSLLGRRVTIISPDGTVVGDNSTDSRRMENHNGRPEVVEARTRGFGRLIRHSNTLNEDMLYVALPFRDFSGQTGVVRVSLEYGVIEQSRAEARRVIWWLSMLVFVASAVLAYLLSHRVFRSADGMAKTAQIVTAGKLDARAPVKGPLELRALGRAFNQMTDRLVSQLRENDGERQKLRTILEGMGEGVLMTDAQGRVEFLNQACRRMLDMECEAEGRKLIEAVRQLDLEKAVHRVVTTGKGQEIELEPHRSRKNILVNLYPVLGEGRVRGVVLVFQDVTELRKLETIRKDFVANVSHELRTPLTSIRGYAETLLGETGLDEPTRREFHSVIYKNASRLSALIDDLLQLSSLESARQNIERDFVDLREIAQSVMTSLQNQFEHKDIQCRLVSDPLVKVQANRRGLEQVFYNLLDNAIKYTSDGGSVEVAITRNGDGACVTVKDTGIGIPAEDLPRIFERFYRVDKSRSREQGGTGLGLSIVKHLVQLHGGTIEVESEVNLGSIFRFRLPGRPV